MQCRPVTGLKRQSEKSHLAAAGRPSTKQQQQTFRKCEEALRQVAGAGSAAGTLHRDVVVTNLWEGRGGQAVHGKTMPAIFLSELASWPRSAAPCKKDLI